MDATAFCSNHVWKHWFWPWTQHFVWKPDFGLKKLSINAPRFESAFWNDVYSKISMDATAFCSNHVWKRWFGLKKLSINAPLGRVDCIQEQWKFHQNQTEYESSEISMQLFIDPWNGQKIHLQIDTHQILTNFPVVFFFFLGGGGGCKLP